ncbi:MAG: hypothetical protein CMH57_01495 [Myxococcales bacterium]|nr:hypothetical protein [Myxococcales bacterium]
MSLTRYTRFMGLLVCCVVVGICACRSEPEDSPPSATAATSTAAATTTDAADPQPEPSPVVGRVGDQTVTLADFRRATRRMSLFHPSGRWEPVPERVLKAPQFQQSTVLSLIDLSIVRDAARAHGVTVTPEEIEERIAREPGLKALAPLSEQERAERLATIGLTLDDLRVVVTDRIVAERLPDRLIEAPDEQRLWEVYKMLEERVVVEFVSIPNTPEAKTLDAFVRTQRDAIERHYADNTTRYTRPTTRRARIIELHPKGDPDEESDQALRERLSGLRTQAMGGVDFAELARAHSAHTSASRGGDLGFVVRPQRPEAFAVKVGEITEPARGRQEGSWFILKVEEELEAHARPLTAPLRREIAAALLRERAPNPGPLAIARSIHEAWAADLKANAAEEAPKVQAILDREKLRRQTTLKFSAVPGSEAFIPGIGSAPPVMTAAAKLTAAEPLTPAPVFYEGNLYVLRLKEKGNPTRTRFEADKEAFAREYLKAKRRSAVQAHVEKVKAERKVTVNLAPVQEAFGVEDKKPN